MMLAVKVIVEVDLGKSPIEFLPAGQRIVGSSDGTPQAVGEAVIVSAGVGIADESVDAVAGAFRLRLNLQTVVVSVALIGGIGNGGILGMPYWDTAPNKRSTRPASQRISGGSTSQGSADVQVISIEQDVVAARPCITSGENNLPGQLALDVDVELLDGAELEIGVLSNNRCP